MPSLIGFVKGRAKEFKAAGQRRALLNEGDPGEITRADWSRSLTDPTRFYETCFRYFHTRLPPELRAHRDYFKQNGRGFGEDAFHVLWFLLFREFKPRRFLEIGVYRGQTLSLAALLQRHLQIPGQVVGISPFSASGDEVSKYRQGLDYLEDTLANCAHFNVPKPELLKAYSTDAAAAEFIRSRKWDCIYIDGNHDYDVALQDWEVCSSQVEPGAHIVLDDSSLNTEYRPPAFATAGHPGPSRIARESDRSQFEEILRVGHNRVYQKR